MNTYPVNNEGNDSTVKLLDSSKSIQVSEPTTVQHEVPSQPSSQELSTQESTQNDTQEEIRIADTNGNNNNTNNHHHQQRQSISSQSSIASVSSTTISSSHLYESDESPCITDLLKRARSYTNNETLESEESRSLIKELITSLNKARIEAGQYKIKAELLSISSKDADMRYEVENDLIKRQVERLKAQGENMNVLMKKISHQKLTLKKYKNEIINKNKEIIRLRSKSQNDSTINSSTVKKRKKSSNLSHKESQSQNQSQSQELPGMLDTLGLLASQVLTEEQKQNNHSAIKANSSHELYQNHNYNSHNTSQNNHNHQSLPPVHQFAMPKLNSFKHRSTPDINENGHNETTISDYSMNQ
ncbi:hypothetical protein BN7_3071 [Wickerhamomyces ciferrii]|uniref:Uncharacterized protein n=1 Tax=Wickerhamomyces ciferrii (strain ATCC 14091 / BCRC 22168 / CBS 111 / JCM 3599 / NBRC 0793 / NRRL Y-1031 F-60-10) TaxID=1206466 RepID=K0KEF6_WICCF|nr:uncharacterized protein BN7_3071 [Wickerhamomyces ciferrii]CCH43520.1 hypothetical protein BN7_3071 [Wickerhamomyces ciferrii]